MRFFCECVSLATIIDEEEGIEGEKVSSVFSTQMESVKKCGVKIVS